MPKLPIEHGDDGRTAREKINDSWTELLINVQNFRPHIEEGIRRIGEVNTWIRADGNEWVWISNIVPTYQLTHTDITITMTDEQEYSFLIPHGAHGKNPEFQFSETHLQQRLEGEEEWKNLIPLSAIRGGTITNVARTSGDGSPWTTDTYTITLSDWFTQTFQVYNGRDGQWSGDMLKANNLSDLTNKAQARENLWAEAKENKKADIESHKTSNTFFPTVKAVYDWVMNKLNGKADTVHTHDDRYYTESEVNTKLSTKADLVDWKVPSGQLPSYVDDVLEFANREVFPATGEKGKIYIAINDDSQWRWTGTGYKKMVSSPWSTDAIPEGTQHLYFTNERAQAALASALGGKADKNHSHSKADVELWKVDNTSDAEKNSAVATLTNKTISWDNNTITKVNSLKNLKDNSELKLWTGNTSDIPAPEAQLSGVIYFGFKQ